MAQEDFDYYFSSANEYFLAFRIFFKRHSYNKAAFELHQTTERLYSALLLVLTRYKPNTHDLKKLGSWVASIEPSFLKVFPQGTEEERKLFELLRKAYVDARYNKAYSITAKELTWLEERIKVLQSMTKEACEKKIESFV